MIFHTLGRSPNDSSSVLLNDPNRYDLLFGCHVVVNVCLGLVFL